MNKKISISLAVTLIFIAMTVTFSVTMVVAMQMFDNTITSISEREAMFSNLSEINTYVSTTGYYDYSYDTVYDTVASGYILGISDRYARYYTAKAYTEYQDIQNGTLIGIGVDLVKDTATGYARVLRVYPGSPAYEAGLTKNCYITAITTADGTRYEVKNLTDVDTIQSRLRGGVGTTVTVDYIGADGTQTTNLTITHYNYSTPTVEGQAIGVCGYIKIYDFTDTTPTELDRTLDSLEGQGIQALVIDLRDNQGGDLYDAMNAVDRLVGSGVLAMSEDKSGEQLALYTSDDTSCDLPMVCLVNSKTAAGAELFASCVKRMEGGSIVGTRTSGQGTIQAAPQRMSNGSAVVVTVARLLVNDGADGFVSFDGEGLMPDTEVALTAAEEQTYYDLTVETDSQIQRAVTTACSMAGLTNVTVTDLLATDSGDIEE